MTKATSFRHMLKGMLADFLEDEGIRCHDTQAALLTLVVALSHYTEEGQSLFPKVLLCADLTRHLALIQGSGPIEVGKGPKGSKTISRALKKCAPLAKGGWVIYVLLNDTEFQYGVFRAPFSPTALDISDTLVSVQQDSQDFTAILASQLTEKAVELTGVRSGRRLIYFSDTSEDAPSPKIALDKLVDLCCSDVPIKIKDPVASFITATLYEAIRECHGTLVAVLPPGDDRFFSDLTDRGGVLGEPIDLAELVREYHVLKSEDTLASLRAYGTLLSGMIASDGIVILDDRCRIRGYNCFVTSKPGIDPAADGQNGGARKRAFEQLCLLVDDGRLRGCFFRSADGGTVFYGGGKP